MLGVGHGKSPCFSEVDFLRLLGLIANSQFCSDLMERKTRSMHFGMETSDKPVQKPKKK
jgi:hypothetical protein